MIGTSDHSRTFLITSIPSKSGKPRSSRTGPALREIQTSCSKSAGIREFRAAAMGLALMSLPFCCRSFPAHSPAPSRHSPTHGKLPAFYPPPRRRRRRVDGVPGGVFCSLFTRDAGLPPKQIRLNRSKTEFFRFAGSLHLPPFAHRNKKSTRFLSKSGAFVWLRGKDLNQRPPGYELRPKASLSPFGSSCSSCARYSQSGWNHHSLHSSPALSAFGSRFGSGK